MNAWKSLSLSLFASLVLVLGVQARAQTSQYKRAKKSSSAPADTPAPAAATDSSAKPAASTTPEASKPSSEKVDISDLENRYWAPKDTEFNVVQNRQYTKANRFAVTLAYGPILNATYVSGDQIGLIGNYYLSERIGVQAMYLNPQVSPNSLVSGFVNQNGVSANYNLVKGYYGVGFNWVPFYAKMSVLEQKILYFDMAITPTIGMTQYQQQTIDSSGSSMSAFTYGFDISQHFFIARWFAIRWDLMEQFYTENVVKFYKTGNDPGNQNAQVTTFLLGAQFFF